MGATPPDKEQDARVSVREREREKKKKGRETETERECVKNRKEGEKSERDGKEKERRGDGQIIQVVCTKHARVMKTASFIKKIINKHGKERGEGRRRKKKKEKRKRESVWHRKAERQDRDIQRESRPYTQSF